jgi:hypothetical protein
VCVYACMLPIVSVIRMSSNDEQEDLPVTLVGKSVGVHSFLPVNAGRIVKT